MAPVAAIVNCPDAVSVSVVQTELASVVVAHEPATGAPEQCHWVEHAENVHD